MDYAKVIEELFEETKDDIIMINGGASCETMAQEAVLCYEQDKNIKLNYWVRMEIEGKLKNKLKAYFERKEQEKKDSKLKLDDIMTDEFGKFGTIVDKVAKVEEEHEEMLNE